MTPSGGVGNVPAIPRQNVIHPIYGGYGNVERIFPRICGHTESTHPASSKAHYHLRQLQRRGAPMQIFRVSRELTRSIAPPLLASPTPSG